jgi:hypothetical protein
MTSDPLMLEAKLQKLERLQQDLGSRGLGLQPEVDRLYLQVWVPKLLKYQREGSLAPTPVMSVVCDVIAGARRRLSHRNHEFAALVHYARTGDPSRCLGSLEDMDRHIKEWCEQINNMERMAPESMDIVLRLSQEDVPQAAGTARNLVDLHRHIILSRGIVITLVATRAVVRCLFGLIRRYRMWLKHEVWWLPLD